MISFFPKFSFPLMLLSKISLYVVSKEGIQYDDFSYFAHAYLLISPTVDIDQIIPAIL